MSETEHGCAAIGMIRRLWPIWKQRTRSGGVHRCTNDLPGQIRAEVFKRRISHRKRSEDRREIHFRVHLCGYPNSAVLPLLGSLEARFSPVKSLLHAVVSRSCERGTRSLGGESASSSSDSSAWDARRPNVVFTAASKARSILGRSPLATCSRSKASTGAVRVAVMGPSSSFACAGQAPKTLLPLCV